MKHLFLCSTILALTPAIAMAQTSDEETTAETTQAQQDDQQNVVALSEWAYDDLYSAGWTVETMFDETRVLGENGDEIGDVENVLIGTDGQIMSLIIEVGGFWDIGDTHVSVPWDQVTLGRDLSEITVPVTQDNVEDHSVFAEEGYFFANETDETAIVDDNLYTGERVFKATELIGDYAYLTGNEQYGYVNDLVFDKEDGQLLAVLIDGSAYGTPGTYAYPYYGYGYGWHPNTTSYALPYGAEEITVVETFDYDQLELTPEVTEASADDAAAPMNEEEEAN